MSSMESVSNIDNFVNDEVLPNIAKQIERCNKLIYMLMYQENRYRGSLVWMLKHRVQIRKDHERWSNGMVSHKGPRVHLKSQTVLRAVTTQAARYVRQRLSKTGEATA